VSQAIPVPQPWVVELVERGLQMLIVLLVIALAILLLVFAACVAYLARSACRCCSKSSAVPELGDNGLSTNKLINLRR
jgi:apolipoprotein N-acyltransferase